MAFAVMVMFAAAAEPKKANLWEYASLADATPLNAKMFRTIYAFFPKELVPEIQSLKSIDPWRRLHPEIVQCVSDFIPKDMRVGAVVVKLICMIRSWHSLF